MKMKIFLIQVGLLLNLVLLNGLRSQVHEEVINAMAMLESPSGLTTRVFVSRTPPQDTAFGIITPLMSSKCASGLNVVGGSDVDIGNSFNSDVL